MLSICVDARMINNSGIGVYIKKYIEFLLRNNEYKIILIGKLSELKCYFDSTSIWEHIEANIPIYSIQEQLKLPFLIPTCDVFWSPHYNIPLFPVKAKKRITTIPDVFHLAHANKLSTTQSIYAKIVTNAAAKLSDKVITISQFSKQEIIRLTGTALEKIETIYLGIDTNLFKYIEDKCIQKQVQVRYKLPEEYILFVGNVKPNKNLRTLVDAFALIAERYPNLHLLIAGKKDGFITGDRTLFDRIDRDVVLQKRIVFSGYVANDDLPVLYSMARVFAFPSLYEGFGFPPLEAMACQCPVLASNRSSVPEICGDAAFYINPYDTESLAKGIQHLLINDGFRTELVKKGLLKVNEYNWLHSQQQFLEQIRQLAAN